MAYVDMPRVTSDAWGCIAPPQSATSEEDEDNGVVMQGRSRSTFGSTVLKLLRSVRI
jgi:hypothetical protein